MLDINFIRENPDAVRKGAKLKGIEVDVEKIIALDDRRRQVLQDLESLRAEQNKKSKNKDASNQAEELRDLKDKIKNLESQLKSIENDYGVLMLNVPNVPASDVHEGKDDSENKVIRKWGEISDFNFEPKDHLDLGEKLNLIDVERAAKVSGPRFAYLKNDAALLEFALVQFAMDILINEGFTPIIPPVLIKNEITQGLGYWEAGGDDYYSVQDEEGKQFYLVGTAEHSIVPMHKDKIFEKSDLPKRYVAFSTCFRREAGSYGKDTRGILRVHQFDKVEMVSFTIEDQDDNEHEYLLSLEEKLFQALNIPYQVVKMCTGDLGFPVARKYDIEAWMPGQNKYREVTSTSTTTDFQARRLNIKYRDGNLPAGKAGEKKFARILNGTAFAIGRTIIAILENYQTKEGTVLVPEVLQKYLGKKEIR